MPEPDVGLKGEIEGHFVLIVLKIVPKSQLRLKNYDRFDDGLQNFTD